MLASRRLSFQIILLLAVLVVGGPLLYLIFTPVDSGGQSSFVPTELTDSPSLHTVAPADQVVGTTGTTTTTNTKHKRQKRVKNLTPSKPKGKKKSDGEKKKLAKEKKKLEAEKKKLEEERAKVEEERAKVEEERAKVEEKVKEAKRLKEEALAESRIIPHKAGIPKILHYTQKQYVDMPSWKQLNPQLDLRFYDNQAMDQFFTDYVHLFKRLTLDDITALTRIEKADLFRYMAIYVLGGIYADSDVTCMTPIDQWFERMGMPEAHLSDLDFLVGIEFEHPVPGPNLPFQFTQFTFAACQGSFAMRSVLDVVEDNILRIPNEAVQKDRLVVLERTGPFAFSKGVFHVVHGPGRNISDYPLGVQPMSQLDQRGQLLTLQVSGGKEIKGVILRKFAFGSNEGRPILTHHGFAGSWKKGELNNN